MLIAIIVLLSFLLIASIIGNILLFKNAEFWKQSNDMNEARIVELKHLVDTVYQDMKAIDYKEWFQKDDDVGIVFQEMVNVIKWFNDVVQNDEDIETEDSE